MNKKINRIIYKSGMEKWAAIRLCIIMLCSSLLGITCAGCSHAGAGISNYADAKNSVAVVAEYVALNGNEAEGLGHGSGFFIGHSGKSPQYLITNHHVIENYLFYGAGEYYTDENGTMYDLKSYIRVYYDSSNYDEAYVAAYNEIADVAVLRLDAPTDKRQALKLCSPTNDMVGAGVYAIGFPGISDNRRIDAISKWGLEDATFTSGVISRLTTTSGSGTKKIQMDAAISAGNSGGPLVNERGCAVGINKGAVIGVERGADEESERDVESEYAVNIDEVIPLLDLHSVPYEMESASGANRTLLLIGGIAALAVIVIIVLLVLARKNDKKNSAKQAPNRSNVPPTAPVSGENFGQAAAVNASGDPQDSGYRLQGVSGALEGRRFMIKKDSPLLLGRSPEDCNVVYPAGTAGVSGRHCEVYFHKGAVYVKDAGSSHGTFLSSGMKLSAGQPVQLRLGDCIWLGSEKETLVLAQKGGN